jgi:CRISPR system Cascade subunit CasD
MGKDVLLLKLEGPLQSWGCNVSGEATASGEYPTKFGVLQVLSNALGYHLSDGLVGADLTEQLRFGVRVDCPGRIIRDDPAECMPHVRQTQQTSKKVSRLRKGDPQTLELQTPARRNQDYMLNAAFLVAFEAVLDGSCDILARCAAALMRPAMPVYLGQRSCPPSRPLFECLTTDYNDVADALGRYPWTPNYETDRRTELTAYVEMLEKNGRLLRAGPGTRLCRMTCHV